MCRTAYFTGVALATLLTGAAGAQTATPETPALEAGTASGAPIPTSARPGDPSATSADIIVTANKRAENINKVGLTITALSQEQLSERRITSLADIAAAVPGLSFAQSSYNTPILTLRGVGFNQQALGSYPAVSVYIDQAPLPFPVMAGHSDYDLERLEVLKGPQGTLFGSNSTGGALNFIAAKPTSEFKAGGDVSYGRFDLVSVNAFASGPLTDSLRARIAVTDQHRDGWQYSITRPGDRNAASRYYAGRLLVDWDAATGVRFSLNANGWRDRSQPQTAQFVALNAQVPPGTPQQLAYPFTPADPRASDWKPGATRPRGDRKFWQAVLRSDIDLTDAVTLTSLTSYAHLTQVQTSYDDGTNLAITGLNPDRSKLSSFDQELRLANAASGQFRWVIGGNFERSKTDSNQILDFQGDTVFPAFGVFQSGDRNSQSIRNYAGFGNVEYEATPNFTLKGGVRYTVSRNDASFCAFDIGDGGINNLFTFLSGVPLTVGQCGSLDATAKPTITPLKIPLHQENVSWRAGVDYRTGPDGLLYANVSRGYKAGSFPALAATSTLQYRPVIQESVTAYEAGVKHWLLDRRVHVNGAIFYYDYRDKQVFGVLKDPVFGPQAALVNVPKSYVFGLESDVSITPITGLTVAGAVTYLKTRITEYTGYTPLTTIRNFKGSRLPFAPTWTYSVAGDYRFEIANGGSAYVGASVQGNSGQDAAIGGSDITIDPVPGAVRVLPGLVHPYVTNPYATIDLRAGYSSPDGSWRVQVWGKNVFDKYYWNNVVTAGDVAAARLAGLPATYGVTLGFAFK